MTGSTGDSLFYSCSFWLKSTDWNPLRLKSTEIEIDWSIRKDLIKWYKLKPVKCCWKLRQCGFQCYPKSPNGVENGQRMVHIGQILSLFFQMAERQMRIMTFCNQFLNCIGILQSIYLILPTSKSSKSLLYSVKQVKQRAAFLMALMCELNQCDSRDSHLSQWTKYFQWWAQ